MKYPFILVLHEKWGDAFYLMEDVQDIQKFAMELLTSRFEAGYYYKPDPVADTFEGYFMAVHNMTVSAAENLATNFNDTVKIGNRAPAAEIASMKSAYIYARAEDTEYEELQKAFEEKDAKLAWKVLYNRSSSGYEYESFSLERIENLKVKVREGENEK